jgi:hypothetical protein
MKAKFIKQRLKDGTIDEFDDSTLYSIDQMESDIHIYSCQLEDIKEELEYYGVVSNI